VINTDVKEIIDTRELRSDDWNLRRRPREPISTEPSESAEARYAMVTATVAGLQGEEPDPGSIADRLVRRYIDRAMLRAATKQYEDGSWFAESLVVPNVWGDGPSEAAALTDLEAVLREWIEMKLANHDGDIPILDGVNLNALSP
jgi:predicted RNase H-like HicB family nuclease